MSIDNPTLRDLYQAGIIRDTSGDVSLEQRVVVLESNLEDALRRLREYEKPGYWPQKGNYC